MGSHIPDKSVVIPFLDGEKNSIIIELIIMLECLCVCIRRGKIHPQKDVRNGVIEYGFPGSQMLEYGFPGGLKAAWGSTNPKITNDHFFPLRFTGK